MKFQFATGGREKYFKVNIYSVRDCVVRAICNATGKDYLEVYNAINELAKSEHITKRHRKRSSARNGVNKHTLKRYIEGTLGWVWVSCSGIGIGCTKHLTEDELPNKGNYILNVSKHLTCLRDGVLYDTYDCSRGGDRCVYGYWREPTAEEAKMHQDSLDDINRYKDFVKKQKEELAVKRAEVKKHNKSIMDKYAKKIRKLSTELRKLERERDKQLLDMPKLELNAWAMESLKK